MSLFIRLHPADDVVIARAQLMSGTSVAAPQAARIPARLTPSFGLIAAFIGREKQSI